MSAHARRRATRLAAAVALIAATSPAARAEAPSGSAVAVDAGTTWSLAKDMEAHPELNPFPDAHGHDATWSLYAGPVGADPSSYMLLPDQADSLCGSSDVRGWREGNLPLVVVNTSDENHCAVAHTVLAHPSPDRDSIIAWTAPLATTVTVSGRLVDDDSGGGNGVGYRLFTGPTTIAEGTIANGGSADLGPENVQVDEGDRVYLAVTALEGNSDYDSTQVDLTISGRTTPPTAALRSATPSTVRQGATTTVTLAGSGFGAQTRVALDDTTGIEVGPPSVVSSKKLRVPVATSGDAPLTTRHWQVFEDGTTRASCSTASACALAVTGAPHLVSVSPSTLQRGQGGDFTLSGAGFAPGMTVTVGGPGLTVGPVAVDSATTARVHLDAATTARLGRRTVTVTNPGRARSMLKRALTVTG